MLLFEEKEKAKYIDGVLESRLVSRQMRLYNLVNMSTTQLFQSRGSQPAAVCIAKSRGRAKGDQLNRVKV
jgi:hypothetical protein